MEGSKATLDLSKLPMPNMEFVVYLLALVVAMIVVGVADTLNVNSWFTFFLYTTVAYVLSRGVAKAHNVKE
jgi:positive regulator of sigma E activity